MTEHVTGEQPRNPTTQLPILAGTVALEVPQEPLFAAPRIEIPGMRIDHLDSSPESMNAEIDRILTEANRRSEQAANRGSTPVDAAERALYDRIELGNGTTVELEICTEDQSQQNGSSAVDAIELKFRSADGTGFEYWLSDNGLVMMHDRPDGGEETVDLFNNNNGGERQFEDDVTEEMQGHAASVVATMSAMMDWAGMMHFENYWRRGKR